MVAINIRKLATCMLLNAISDFFIKINEVPQIILKTINIAQSFHVDMPFFFSAKLFDFGFEF